MDDYEVKNDINEKVELSGEKPKCFVIMPIGELKENPPSHFKRVYEDIFVPAIRKAGFEPYRSDESLASNMIQVNIIKAIVDAPMVLCDLSTRNPNVLFELGIRQAFDKPVVLVQEEGTPKIFDISTINTITYRKERIYDEVMNDREEICKAIVATKEDSSFNSIIKLLQIESANITSNGKMNVNQEIRFMLRTLMNDVAELKQIDDKFKLSEKRIFNENYFKSCLTNDNYIKSCLPNDNDIKELDILLRQIENIDKSKCSLSTIKRLKSLARYYKNILLNEENEKIYANYKSKLYILENFLNEA